MGNPDRPPQLAPAPVAPQERESQPSHPLDIVHQTTARHLAKYPGQFTLFGTTIIDRATISNALRTHQYPDKTSSTDPMVVPHLLSIVRNKEADVRRNFLEAISHGETFGLEAHEVALLTTFCLAGNAAEQLYLSWQQDMDAPVTAKAEQLTNFYTIPVEGADGAIEEQTWATRYPKEIGQIARYYSLLAQEVQAMPTEEAAHLGKAAEAFVSLLTETDIHKIKKVGDQFDNAWMDYQGKVQFVFPRDEGYAGRQMYPEIRLVLVEPEKAPATEGIKHALLDYLATQESGDGSEKDVVRLFKNDLARTQLMPSFYLNETGITTLRPAAESLPNDQIPREAKGTRIYVMLDALKSRWEEAVPLMDHLTSSSQKFFSNFDYITAGTFFVLVHELAEPFAETEKLRDTLGSRYGHINEDMATKFGNVVASRLEETQPDILKDHLAYIAFSTLRYINNALTDPTLQNYMMMAYKQLDELVTTGVLTLTPDNKINFDFSDQKVAAWSQLAERNLAKLVGITEFGQKAQSEDDAVMTRDMVESYLSMSDENRAVVQQLIRIVHPTITNDIDFPFNTKPHLLSEPPTL